MCAKKQMIVKLTSEMPVLLIFYHVYSIIVFGFLFPTRGWKSVSRALEFDTVVDAYVRTSGETRRKFAEQALISPSTLLKARALDPARGRLHWTSLVLIGVRMGIFKYGESIGEDDPRLRKLAPGNLRTSRGRGAPRWYGYQ